MPHGNYRLEAGGENACFVVSPDVEGLVRAPINAKRSQADLAIIDKRREGAGVPEVPQHA